MPELPEVETTRRGLSQVLKMKPRIVAFHYLRKDLRFPMPQKKLQALVGCEIEEVSRRAKYLLIKTRKGFLLSHLGMTGTWRVGEIERLHDHFAIELSNGQKLIYNDPRRFGFIDFVPLEGTNKHPRLKDLGFEPFDTAFSAAVLKQQFLKKTIACKVALMDQKIVVGVGNIYASESLFLAKVNPQKKASKLSLQELEKIVESIRTVLEKAIAAGGSTISDFKNAAGEGGYFQTQFQVYDRKNQKCTICKTSEIKLIVQGGRSTFFCPKCQPLSNKKSTKRPVV